ncbi:hypothetical protein K1T71_014261 [Dendrolimus kikuchii]|uniref:Uncharacterized protein n=1 Tax=Dendrolimus kikuchii TaxID=765133 RepID=A0ACC1CFH6_9NEOP|nr:hypothetical protein K1T71_014261 [Dendrolimus kikuchii]
MSMADVTSVRSTPAPEACPECDTSASVTSDLHKYQVACTCKPSSAQYACADDPGPPPPAKTDTPPALPPRPPTSVLAATNRRNNATVGCNGNETSCRRRKYAWWCVGCGALAAALGGLLAAQHILLRAYTASPQHLETVPAAVPAAMLVLTGVCIMSLARRRNRYSYMVRKIKVVGACCLVCALTCVLVTITTTVIHMNKLQTLKFCEYTKRARTCTCYSISPEKQHTGNEEDIRCEFEGVSSCGVIHGALYWCLRGVFALSVSAVLVCIFSCMLAYQLLSHERKKMYWEQLELRCRSLYRPPSGQSAPTTGRPTQTNTANCSCCTQCHPTQPAWDISLQHRFWAPGRIGNLYSPNPGTGRKTSAWSWFPWPRSNSQNSRCRMGVVPQSGDSAYGFCETEANANPQPYDERGFQANAPQPYRQPFNQAQQMPQAYPQGQPGFPASSFSEQSFSEASGSFDAQTGVWGPPPPYSPQGRSGSRHHLHHQDPAAATLLHHHHIDVHRSSMPIHDHTIPIQTHTCARTSYLIHNIPADISRINPDTSHMSPDISRMNPDMSRMNPDVTRMNPDMSRMNPDMTRMNPDTSRMNPDFNHLNRLNPDVNRMNPDLNQINRLNPDLSRLNPDMNRLNPDPNRLNPDMGMYPPDEMARFQEICHLPDPRLNTLRHVLPYRCRRMGASVTELQGECRPDDGIVICHHQKSASKVSDQSSDSCQKQGKENLGFQNDKHSPIRSSMQDCRAANQNAESEVYFADVSSCCNVSLKAECCMNANVSALVGTIENHPESTSESDTGSFTLTRQQRPQPQVGSKRRPRQTDKHTKSQEKIRQALNSSVRLTEHQIEQLNNTMRMTERICDPRIERIERMNETRMSERMDSRDRLNMNETRLSERHDSRDRLNERTCELNECRIDRMNDSRHSERLSERMNDSRIEKVSDLNSSVRCDGSPRSHILPLRLPKVEKPEFFVPPPPVISPISPKTEESLLSDDDRPDRPERPERPKDQVYSNDPEPSKCLSPDAQYEQVGDNGGTLEPNHHHWHSDTNTMDSGWQSGEDRHTTD